MRIFLSHSSRIKPLVREVRGYLPEHVNTWIDERDVLAGDPLERSIRNAIESNSDFLVVFVDESAIRSEWVRKELSWANEEEERLGRPFILPVLVDEVELDDLQWLRERLYLKCHGFRETDIRQLAGELSSELFAWLSRDLEALRKPPAHDGELSILDEADSLLRGAAQQIRTLVFPHRKANPLRISSLYDRLRSGRQVRVTSPEDLHELLFRLQQRNLLARIVMSGGTMYVEEEHLNWRSQEAIAAKQAVADTVVNWIGDGDIVFLDAGSSTARICENMCRSIRFREWDSLTVVTNSVPIAGQFAKVANDLGLEDLSPQMSIYVLGTRMRTNTSCLVEVDGGAHAIEQMADRLEGFTIAFVGTNGIYWPDGCTTTSPLEAAGKRAALSGAARRVVLAESTKYNIRQYEVFATFDMQLEIATASDENRSMVEGFAEHLEGTKSQIVFI